MTLPVVFTANGQAGYNLTKSLRFRSSASAYLNRTPASASNRKTFTISAWVKKGQLGVDSTILSAGYNTAPWFIFAYDGTNDTLDISATAGSSSSWKSAAYFRDPSAWYHVMCVVDTTSATATITNTATDRIRLYVNGVQQTLASGTVPTQNSDLQVNNTVAHSIGGYSGEYFDGYLAEVNFVDGQALTPSSFGTTDAYGIWQPIRYSGTYGTNGFYLPFTNTTSTTTLVADSSGNGNNWTPNNISLTSGSTYDSMTDVPTLTSATTANYATLNPLDKVLSPTVINGNLSATVGDNAEIRGTIYVSSGKWYWEIIPTTMTFSMIGIGIGGTGIHWGSTGVSYYGFNGNKYVNGSSSSYGASYTNNDVIGVALDLDNLQITFYKNNTSQGTITGLTAGLYTPALSAAGNSSVYNTNFGQQPFAYTPPTGFVALNTFNLPTPTIGATASTIANEYFDATTYTGTGSTQNITNSGSMQPDWVWIKNRSSTNSHQLTDSVRGVNLALASDLTIAEFAGNINAFNTNGFQVTGASNAVNASGQTYVAWQWRASNATAVSNTAGSITSTVSANTTAGFSIVTYTGTGANATVGHGLGVAPSMVIVKARSTTGNWCIWHTKLTSGAYALFFNTDAQDNYPTIWNSTIPTSTVFSIGTASGTNVNGQTQVAYCFAPIAGYSAFGSYTGNGSTDGTFVYTGFRPRFVLIKASSRIDDWKLIDTARDPYNLSTQKLYPNLSAAENGSSGETSSTNTMDIVSNGFKLRTSNSATNENGATYIYACFAENPFKYANAR